MPSLSTIFWLSLKEVRSVLKDWVLLGLVAYAFSLAIIAQSQSSSQELDKASIGFVDEDDSELSRRIVHAFLPPRFKRPARVRSDDVDRAMASGRYTFILDIPPHFQRDVIAGRSPVLQVLVDATAMTQAGIGANYAKQIIDAEVAGFMGRGQDEKRLPVDLVIRIAFNPNATTAWFTSVMGIINNVTMLAIILAGAAVVREREHGTMDHLLVMPVTPFEIAMAKIVGNGAIVIVAVWLALVLVVRQLLQVPLEGSIALFLVGVAIYLFFAMSVGIFLATVARTMPQLGLLFLLVAVPLNLLSGATTPLESMPPLLRSIMEASPSTHFVSYAQAILYRGAGLDLVWREYAGVGVAGALFLWLGVVRFRKALNAA
jgi:ABC-2 type transport system permease protein